MGHRSAAAAIAVSPRWLMNYAAAISDQAECFYGVGEPLRAHPLFHAYLEWRLQKAVREGPNGLSSAERGRAVHAAQELTLYRPLKAGDRLSVRATVDAIDRPPPGARMRVRFETLDAGGRAVARALSTTIFRGVEVEGSLQPAASPPAPPPAPAAGARTQTLSLSRSAAHVYSECARIFNPIHTDPAAARLAGLGGPILHGSATLAMAVSNVIRHEGGGDPERVREVRGRFRAPVPLPADIQLGVDGVRDAGGRRRVWFTVLNQAGQPAITDGLVELIL